MESMQHTAIVGLVVVACLASAATAETRREYRYPVGPKASVTVDTEYGSISVKPGTTREVVVVALIHSDKAKIDISQEGNRLEFESHLLPGADEQTGRVDYEVTVPRTPPSICIHRTDRFPPSASRPMLRSKAPRHRWRFAAWAMAMCMLKTMKGTITLSDVRSAHVEITSISGDVT